MFYSFDITIPANTLQASPQKTILKLCYGIIHKVDIVFPSGCSGLVGISVNNATHQVWPTNRGQHFCSDGETISWREFLENTTEPFELNALAWNTDQTYEHRLTVRVGVLPLSVVAPWLLAYIDRLNAALGIE